MFRSGIDLGGKTHILKVGLLASLALLRCQRSLNSLVKCTTSRVLVNCLWTHQKSTCLHINEAPCSWQGSSSHTYLSPWEPRRFSWKPQNKGASHSRAGVSSHTHFGDISPDHPIWKWKESETMIRKRAVQIHLKTYSTTNSYIQSVGECKACCRQLAIHTAVCMFNNWTATALY